MTEVQTRSGMKNKPSTIIEYNSVKSYIDVSDQISSYSNPVRRSIKWYRKVGIEIFASTCVVNALILYNTALDKKMDVTTFRESLVEGLYKDEVEIPTQPTYTH